MLRRLTIVVSLIACLGFGVSSFAEGVQTDAIFLWLGARRKGTGESAGINRHRVEDERALHESDS